MSTTTSAIPINYQLSVTTCSQCSSMAHFQCLDHCKDVFCGKCSVKHRNEVMKRMDNLKEQLQLCKIDPVTTHDAIDENFYRASQETIRRTRSTVKNLISELEQRQDMIIKEIEKGIELRAEERKRRTDSALLTSEEAVNYTDLLGSCLKHDQLLDADDIVNIQRRLDARNALGQSASEAKNPLIELGKFEPEKILRFRHAPRPESSFDRSKSANTITVTIRLGKHKQFKAPIEGAFSVGKHPTAISLNDRYLETFFLRRTPGNSLILLSTTAVDFVNRGSGVENSIHLSKILGTNKDKLVAGTWCERSQRLLFVANHRMYLFDMQIQRHAKKFRCEPKEGDPVNSARFITCTHNGSILYAYKSGTNIYTVEKHREPSYDLSHVEDTTHFFNPENTVQINGRVAAMCHTHNRLAFVYQHFQSNEHVKHFFCLFDHNLARSIKDDVALPNSIKWITAITPLGNDGRYLLCDPRGQQLLLYRTSDGILTRRFRIGAINACCLTDGKLVLWLQKQYASSPTAKLHFITAPHLEEPANVAKSFPLLTNK